MKNEINLSAVYYVKNQVFNVGENGTKQYFDPIARKKVAYGSATNVKHCLKEEFINILGIEPPKKVFVKTKSKKGDKESENAQGGVSTLIDLKNPVNAIFGAWNACQRDFGGEKFLQLAIKSALRIGQFAPIHPYLCADNTQCGCHNGDYNSVLGLKLGDKIYTNIDDIPQNTISQKEAKEFFESERKMNFYKLNTTTSGIYRLNIHIEMDKFGLVDLCQCQLSEEEIGKYLESGFYKYLINNKEYLGPSKEDRINLFRALVDALFSWNFQSNNSNCGDEKELLRTTVSHNNAHLWQTATYAEIVDTDKKEAQLVFAESNPTYKEKLIANDVFSFNTPLLQQYYNTTENNIECDWNAIENTKEKMMTFAEKIINNQ